ncbi:MAG: YihY/virulence factor BrkB family protein [Armatimonadota bacterium]|nr:YihY/virulence factor BrkB family protein [Armatimonadota bacterium]
MSTYAPRSPSPKAPIDTSKWPAVARVLWAAILRFGDDGCARHAAALAFFCIFSIGPFLFVAVPIVQFIAGDLKLPMQDVIGYEAGDFGSSGLLGFAVLMWSASGASTALVSSFGRIFQKTERVEAWWRKSLIERLIGISLVFAGGLALASFSLASLLITISTGAFQEFVTKALDFLATWVLAATVMACIYRWVPYHFDLRWKSAWIGGAVGGLLGAILKSVYATLIKTAGLGNLYAAANSLVLLMMFVYLAALTLFFGAEIAKAVDEHLPAKDVAAQVS